MLRDQRVATLLAVLRAHRRVEPGARPDLRRANHQLASALLLAAAAPERADVPRLIDEQVTTYLARREVIDPNGEVVGTIRNTILPSSGRYYTYYYYRPSAEDTPGDWTYQMYVDGRNAFEARIPVLSAK